MVQVESQHPEQLEEAILTVLRDAPRPGAPTTLYSHIPLDPKRNRGGSHQARSGFICRLAAIKL